MTSVFIREYWENLRPAGGRPLNPALSRPDNWWLNHGAEGLEQQTQATEDLEMDQYGFMKQQVIK